MSSRNVHSGPSPRKALSWRPGGWYGTGGCSVSKVLVEHLLNSILTDHLTEKENQILIKDLISYKWTFIEQKKQG